MNPLETRGPTSYTAAAGLLDVDDVRLVPTWTQLPDGTVEIEICLECIGMMEGTYCNRRTAVRRDSSRSVCPGGIGGRPARLAAPLSRRQSQCRRPSRRADHWTLGDNVRPVRARLRDRFSNPRGSRLPSSSPPRGFQLIPTRQSPLTTRWLPPLWPTPRPEFARTMGVMAKPVMLGEQSLTV
jgi:hypothetical protein